jgi:hypothetical protein
MKIKAIIGVVTFTLKKYSPEILLGVGVVGVVGSTVLACKATLKAEKILEEHREKKELIDECVECEGESHEGKYTLMLERQDRRALMLTTVGKFVRAYGPPATLMAASVGCILGAYRIMAKRNVALMAAYKVIEEAFTKYRKRVVDELGEKADARFLYGLEPIEGAETRKVIDKDGEEREVSPMLANLSGFSRFFEADKPDQYGSWTGSTQWSKVHEYNLDFLNAKMEHFNTQLLVKGFVTINEVFEELGFPSTEAGMVCGWRYKSDRGDGYVSFRPRGIDGNWTYGRDGESIILDFNVDGCIFDEKVARKEMK